MLETTANLTAGIMALEDAHTSGLYSKRPLVIVRGQGARLWDSDGKEYIDCVGGQGAANLGHANERVAAAVTKQVNQLISCPEMFYSEPRARLESRLSRLTGLRRAFFCNSGTEAVEAAIKFARLSTGRSGVTAAMRGFHGRTMGALSATWEKKYRQPFEPLVPGYRHFAYNDLNALDAAVTGETAALVLEVVQGEGGVRLGERAFLEEAQSICQARGALLILDEVQTGFGRTGRLFAHQHYDLQPDLLCLAKSIAGGLPMGAVMIGDRVSDLPTSAHGSTFGGNPLACAGALAVLDEMEEKQLPERAARLGEAFIQGLRRIDSPLIREVRGLGLMVGVELKQKATPYLQALMANGVLALPAGLNVIRFLPPLVIEPEDLKTVTVTLKEVLNNDNKL